MIFKVSALFRYHPHNVLRVLEPTIGSPALHQSNILRRTQRQAAVAAGAGNGRSS